MKPSSFAAVVIRLAALCTVTIGILMMAAFVGEYRYLESLIEQNGPPSTITGNLFGFQFAAPSLAVLFRVQMITATGITLFGAMIFRIAKPLGRWIGRDLDAPN